MAQPKRRWSKARTHSKRSTWKKELPTMATCPHCHEPVMPHRVCKNCGYYDGKEIEIMDYLKNYPYAIKANQLIKLNEYRSKNVESIF